jgi:hypothetical protein
VSYITPTHHSSSSPTPHPLDCSGRGSSDPTGPHTSACSPNPAQNRATAARFGFLAPTPASLAFREPAAPPLSLPHTGHPTTSPYGVIPPYLMARPESSPSGSVSGFCGPNRLPASRFTNAPPYDRRYLIRAVPPSSPIFPRRRFQQRAPNRAPAARFRVF